jgi:hypothetical protein
MDGYSMLSSMIVQKIKCNRYLCKLLKKREISVYTLTVCRSHVIRCNPE